jgi:hypothetical protein
MNGRAEAGRTLTKARATARDGCAPIGRKMSRAAAIRSESILSTAGLFAADGFTITELIVAMLVSMMVCGSLAVLAGDARMMFRVQPETADLLQRARVGHALLLDELSVAGAGLQTGREPQPLVRWIPPVLPYARAVTGTGGSDADGQAFRDRITLLGVPDNAPQASVDGGGATTGGGAESGGGATTTGGATPAGGGGGPAASGGAASGGAASSGAAATGGAAATADVIPLARGPACGGAADATCGFAEGQRVLLFDSSPAFDIATVQAVSPFTLQLVPSSVSKGYRAADDARVAVANVTTFSFDAARRQLRRSTADGIDVPALDDVVELSFRYFADPYPPEGPRPPPGESNCLFEASGVTRLPVLAADDGSLIELPPAAFTDGPFCGTSPYRFDADLYRIRRVHVRLRLQAASASLRGRDPLLFRLPGHASSPGMRIPDMVVEFDIAPRNLQVR